MSKDPAILFYTSDFIMGTYCMSHEQLGIYMRLLCIQHQCGGLIEKEAFKAICGTHDIVKSKFVETDDGFFNKRMMEEMTKRQHKSQSLSANAQKRWKNQCKSNAIASDLHMPIGNGNEDRNRSIDDNSIKSVVFKPPTVDEVRAYCAERKNSIDAEAFVAHYQASGWKRNGGVKIKDWKACVITWEKRQGGKDVKITKKFLN